MVDSRDQVRGWRDPLHRYKLRFYWVFWRDYTLHERYGSATGPLHDDDFFDFSPGSFYNAIIIPFA